MAVLLLLRSIFVPRRKRRLSVRGFHPFRLLEEKGEGSGEIDIEKRKTYRVIFRLNNEERNSDCEDGIDRRCVAVICIFGRVSPYRALEFSK
jgi:hypothetical protein